MDELIKNDAYKRWEKWKESQAPSFIKLFDEVLDDERLSPRQVIFLSLIIALSNNEQCACWAGNSYFMKKGHCSLRQVQEELKGLEKFGWIEINTFGNKREIVLIKLFGRFIKL